MNKHKRKTNERHETQTVSSAYDTKYTSFETILNVAAKKKKQKFDRQKKILFANSECKKFRF